MELSKDILVALSITQLVGICVLVWRMAIIYSEFNYRVEKNKNDINGLAQRLEQRIDYQYSIINSRINHISQHLERTDNYNTPTFDRFND